MILQLLSIIIIFLTIIIGGYFGFFKKDYKKSKIVIFLLVALIIIVICFINVIYENVILKPNLRKKFIDELNVCDTVFLYSKIKIDTLLNKEDEKINLLKEIEKQGIYKGPQYTDDTLFITVKCKNKLFKYYGLLHVYEDSDNTLFISQTDNGSFWYFGIIEVKRNFNDFFINK